ncbi:MAG: RNA-binding cell elongation regulator Jag/EloR [Anaerolineae bacterium]|jgi:spoIIIJ-associated protein|nr:RNA-binding cell elongation regulator Jag/EloR [Anaerolineae bacterium]
MAKNKNYVDITASTVEEAIDTGLEMLGLTRSQAEVEILAHPRAKILGFGGRDALVRIKKQGFVVPEPVVEKAPEVKEKPEPKSEPKKQAAETSAKAEAKADVKAEVKPKKASESTPAAVKPAEDTDLSEDDQVVAVAVEVVTELLEKMRIQAEVSAHFVEPEDELDEKLLWVDVEGNDLSILIGRRSETLNALQYISSLIINKQMGKLVPLMIDVQGYRDRRTNQIKGLALRMAEQCVKQNRRQMLEPMSAHERRIVHLALRNHPDVYTESVGEGSSRKVTIIPKNK